MQHHSFVARTHSAGESSADVGADSVGQAPLLLVLLHLGGCGAPCSSAGASDGGRSAAEVAPRVAAPHSAPDTCAESVVSARICFTATLRWQQPTSVIAASQA